MNSPTPLILVLALIGTALACAALYALFGNPSTSQNKKRKQQVISGFQLAGGILLGCVLMVSLVGFAGIALGNTASSLAVSRPLAGVIAVSALILIALMVQCWVKYFAGWMAWGVLSSLMMAISGHLLNNPAIPVRRSTALIMAALILVTVAASARFAKADKLKVVDKLALMTWIVAFTVAANFERFSIAATSIGTLALVLAGVLGLSKRRGGKYRTLSPKLNAAPNC